MKCFVYLDDIVIYADTLETHEHKLSEIFKRLDEHNLKLQPDKCNFLRHEVVYLGHVISKEGVKPDPSKISAVSKFPIPRTPTDIKSFLGLAGYYRKFIPNFAKIAQPLTAVLKKDILFNWTDKRQSSFENLKSKLISKPILIFPNIQQPFILTIDASNFAIGAVLSQGEIFKDLPIAYASRTLNQAEKNYSTTEKE